MKYFGLILLLTIGCTQRSKDSVTTQTSDSVTNEAIDSKLTTTDSTKQKPTKRIVTIIVKDSTKYSKRFLAGLRAYGPGHKFELKDDEIVTDDSHQTKIIQLIPKRETVILRGQKNDKKYELRLQRIDYTSVSYEFLFTDKDGKLLTEQGIGDIRSDFMLGSGMDEDDKGLGYGISSEYWTNDDRKKLSSISLGVVNGKIVGRINGLDNDFKAQEAPFLKSEQKPAPLQ